MSQTSNLKRASGVCKSAKCKLITWRMIWVWFWPCHIDAKSVWNGFVGEQEPRPLKNSLIFANYNVAYVAPSGNQGQYQRKSKIEETFVLKSLLAQPGPCMPLCMNAAMHWMVASMDNELPGRMQVSYCLKLVSTSLRTYKFLVTSPNSSSLSYPQGQNPNSFCLYSCWREIQDRPRQVSLSNKEAVPKCASARSCDKQGAWVSLTPSRLASCIGFLNIKYVCHEWEWCV